MTTSGTCLSGDDPGGEPERLVFFLGGRDLEMLAIGALLRQSGARLHDRAPDWSQASISFYRPEVENLKRDQVPVLVELANDLQLQPCIAVDHHQGRAGAERPTSLHQVFQLLRLPSHRWTRWHELVAANDRGYIPAMREVGADAVEIRRVRDADRAAQGIDEEHDREARRALSALQLRSDGCLAVARLGHGKTAALTDLLDPAYGGSGYKNLLIASPNELNFFGAGGLVLALARAFPGSWFGGSLPERGFWGVRTDHLESDLGKAASLIEKALSPQAPQSARVRESRRRSIT
ncbi:MAG: hypothetical protein ACE5JX_18265 [Acidobacteriota bacterium]